MPCKIIRLPLVKEFQVGDRVKAFYVSGNMGKEYTRSKPVVGLIESIGTDIDARGVWVYKISGVRGCFSDDEMEYLTPYEQTLIDELENIKESLCKAGLILRKV